MHWCLAPPMVPQSRLGPDGHPARGDFLPPVPLPRRMWAAGRLEFFDPLRVGDRVARHSKFADVNVKEGRSGRLCFVAVEHEISTGRGLALKERHDIVYRDAPSGNASKQNAPAREEPRKAQWSKTKVADAVMLFRYSALTFNGHRIHYDRQYVTQEEGYPGLIVHGPLIATLLMDLLRREMPGADVASFRFKAVRPTFDLHAFHVSGQPQAAGKTVRLWASDHEGWLTMDATAVLR